MLGIAIGSGEPLGLGLIVAIFISNLPEATGSASELLDDGTSRRDVLGLWVAVAVVCTAGDGRRLGDLVGGERRELRATIDGFAAGALLVMLDRLDDPRRARGRRPPWPASWRRSASPSLQALSSLS